MKMDDTFERICTLMKEMKIQDQEMISFLGLSKGTFANWRRNNGRSYYEHIDKIADRLGVSIDFLIRGEDLKTDSLSHQEYELIENFRKLTEKGKKVVSAGTKLLAEK